jgi:hypothetical protein
MKRLLAVLLVLSFSLSGCLRSKVIAVEIVNASDSPIRNVEVLYPGGSYGVPQLAPRQHHSSRIKPLSPGALQIKYDDATGAQKSQVGPRLHKDATGTVSIVIDSSGLKWTETIQ